MKRLSATRNPFFESIFSMGTSLRAKLIVGFSSIAAFASLVTAIAAYSTMEHQTIENFQRRALSSVSIAALQQNGDDFEKIASENDPLYEEFRLQNLRILKSDPDFIYVYTLRKDSQGIYFAVDGNEPDAEGFSPYGTRYLEPSPYLVENFDSMTVPIVEPKVYSDEYGSFLSAYAPIVSSDGRQVGVIALDISANAIFEAQRQIIIQSVLIFLAVFAAATILGNLAGNALMTPLKQLAQGASIFTQGRFDQRVDIHVHDEIGNLGKIFNGMAEEIQKLVGGLEQRVAERTADLEQSRQQSVKRAAELQSIGEISKIIAGEQKLENLLPLITLLVSERFGFYHVGIFLVESSNQFAVLQAANSAGGQNMLKRGHKLEVGGSGIVGHVARSGKPRISLDVGQDAVYFNNPDLPNTRSEMALPLKVRDSIVGVLDVQSEKPGAFTDTDAKTLSILADQIAIALENARLLTQTQQALSEVQALYRRNLQEGWKMFSREKDFVGYRQDMASGTKLTTVFESDEINQAMNRGEALIFHADGVTQEASIVVPIKMRGQIIGSIRIKAPVKNRQWSNDEINLVETISERLSIALDNARLIEESQRQAVKEQTIGEVTSRISSSISLKNVLQTAVEELGRVMPGSDVVLQLQHNGEIKK